ncbi:MAG: PadR family transcriptional regulator [Bacteroidota bacterium]
MKLPAVGEFEELVLLTVAGQHDQAYGVSIQQSLMKHLKRDVNIASIHIVLKRLTDKGMVQSRYGGITAERGGRRKKYYVITAFGKQVLDEQYDVRTSMYRQIPNISFGS